MEWSTRFLTTIICLMFAHLTGVSAYNSDIVGITVAACVGFFLFTIIIAIIVVSFQWTEWFNHWMNRKGKVRMPKAYFKKKEEAKKRLINGSVASHTSEVNGKLPAQSIDRDGQRAVNGTHFAVASKTNMAVANHSQQRVENPYWSATPVGVQNGGIHQKQAVQQKEVTTSWVQGWNQRSAIPNKVYEEKDVTMELGEEDNDEFRIETVLVDNEVLDVGPYRTDHSKEVAVRGDVYPEPYIYSTVDPSKKSSVRGDVQSTTVVTATKTISSTEMSHLDVGYSTASDVRVVQSDEELVRL